MHLSGLKYSKGKAAPEMEEEDLPAAYLRSERREVLRHSPCQHGLVALVR